MRKNTTSKSRTPRDYIGLVARGFAMGSADVVPGVSGGTMAFILGIYEELIHSIRSITQPPFVKALKGIKVRDIIRESNAYFLIAVFSGIMLAVLTLAHSLEQALEQTPELVWSFFFGLVLASIVVVNKRIRSWTPGLMTTLILGSFGSYILVGLVPVHTPESWWFLMLSGALAICAMILPGISGAFILVLLGKYEFILSAVNDRDFTSILFVGIGAVMGLLSFARLLGWLFKRFHDSTVALMMGFMVGSLRKIWPWKQMLQDQEFNIMPSISSDLALPLILMITGSALILMLESYAKPTVHEKP